LHHPISITLSYHERTKHHLDRYARALGYLDWATQPNPFRTFVGAARLELPLAAESLTTPYADLFLPGEVAARSLDRTSIGILFELALGLSAWKQFGGKRWALRCNPSSGNLHPTEGYAILPTISSLDAGVYHYVSRDHCLEHRCRLNEKGAAELGEALPADSFLIGITSIHWREAWKYGERAFRYCQHDAGHAIATIRFAAAALGWPAVLLEAPGDDKIAALLGLDRESDFAGIDPQDREHPDALILVSREPHAALLTLPVSTIRDGQWTGHANALSPAHVKWDAIDDIARATWKPPTNEPHRGAFGELPPLRAVSSARATDLIRQRRSCQALDGRKSISAAHFYRMLDCLLPRPSVPPWDSLSWSPLLHVAIFVHRVDGLDPGLYVFERDPAIHDPLRAALRPKFLWQRPAGCPEHLHLYYLMPGDLRQASRTVSCHQEIAADGAFSLGMIASFGEPIRTRGQWWYRRLFWEAGILGHALYLEAEAAGVRSTGIGCYFDDVFHKMLGLTGDAFQDLYHFTVGTAVEDKRLMTLPPYDHLQRR
jgi:SagB-type dehydrogenase family enzyme